jgi:prevent-host-death family protein
MSKSVSIFEAKTHLSQILKTVKMGKEVMVTERGVPIAKIIPISKLETFSERVESLKRNGQIISREKTGIIPEQLSWPSANGGALKRFLDTRED